MMYYILSWKWTEAQDRVYRDLFTWYQPNESGYTQVLEFAGRYTEEEARRITAGQRDGGKRVTQAIACEVVERFASQMVCTSASAIRFFMGLPLVHSCADVQPSAKEANTESAGPAQKEE